MRPFVRPGRDVRRAEDLVVVHRRPRGRRRRGPAGRRRRTCRSRTARPGRRSNDEKPAVCAMSSSDSDTHAGALLVGSAVAVPGTGRGSRPAGRHRRCATARCRRWRPTSRRRTCASSCRGRRGRTPCGRRTCRAAGCRPRCRPGTASRTPAERPRAGVAPPDPVADTAPRRRRPRSLGSSRILLTPPVKKSLPGVRDGGVRRLGEGEAEARATVRRLVERRAAARSAVCAARRWRSTSRGGRAPCRCRCAAHRRGRSRSARSSGRARPARYRARGSSSRRRSWT